VQQSVLEVGVENVPEMLKEICKGLGPGTIPSEAKRELQGDRQGQLDWRRFLRRYVGQSLEVRPVFNRPPRRFPDLVGIVPGRRHLADRPMVMAVIDTSGSITPDLLELINAELAHLAKAYDVTVVECDCAVHRVYTYSKPLQFAQGGGGTDFRPPLERTFLRKHSPDLIIYFTDGEGPAPERSPRVRVIWCLTPQGRQPAEWGRAIWMAESPEAD
jgi:predicted metal-dependent peptidase